MVLCGSRGFSVANMFEHRYILFLNSIYDDSENQLKITTILQIFGFSEVLQTISVEFPYKNSAKLRKNRKFAKWRLILEVIQNPTKIQNKPELKPVPNREPHGAARYQVRLPADQYTIRSSCATAQKSTLSVASQQQAPTVVNSEIQDLSREANAT